MGLLGNIAGNLVKNIFPKHTVAGKLLGSTRSKTTKMAAPATTKQTVSQVASVVGAALNPPWYKQPVYLVGGGLGVIVIILIAALAFKPKKRRR